MSDPKHNADPKDAPKKVEAAKADGEQLTDEELAETAGGWNPKVERSPDKFDPLLVSLLMDDPDYRYRNL